jgi:MerR family copper efflux transcriptional regulator
LRSGELARQAGVSSDTLRHYERLGLLPKPPRSEGGYRNYPGHTLGRVRLIRRALSAGFSLPELSAILKIRDEGGVPCHRVRALAEAKLAEVDEKIRELIAMRKQLEQTLKSWGSKLTRLRPGEQARLLETLPEEATVLRRLALSSNKNKKGGHK